jgi:carbamoyl-phosphate synthase large subunit
MGSDRDDLVLSIAHNKYLVPKAIEESYFSELMKVVEKEKPDFVHAQNDREVLELSKFREELAKMGTRTFLPDHKTIEVCVDKWKSYCAFKAAGIKVPKNSKILNEEDLRNAFKELANEKGFIWLRSNEIGGGGIGALPTNDYLFAKKWIDHHKGWSRFLAAEMLTPATVTWSSIWHEGTLVVAQTRSRGGWVHGNRTLSGVTGVTKVGQTTSSPLVDDIALAAIKSVDSCPHGIFSVDMAYDSEGIPNPTEINIARFFTTVYFENFI